MRRSRQGESEAARALGLCVHTVFVGGEDERYPAPLTALAAATGGTCFFARVEAGSSGQVRLSWRGTELGWEKG